MTPPLGAMIIIIIFFIIIFLPTIFFTVTMMPVMSVAQLVFLFI